MTQITKITLAILLFLCLAPLPYGYYQLVRVLATAGFIFLVTKEQRYNILYIALAILFQPLLKISLGRELWNVVDVIVGCFLIYTIIRDKK